MTQTLLLALALASACAAPPASAAGPVLRDARWDTKSTHTRFVFEFTEEVSYRFHDDQATSGHGYIDFHNVSTAGWEADNRRLDDARVVWLRRDIFPRQRVLRFIFDTDAARPITVMALQSPFRVVLDVHDRGAVPAGARHEPARLAGSSPSGRTVAASANYAGAPLRYSLSGGGAGRPLLVAIDPGHGGRDPGAMSRTRVNGRTLTEKELAMAISRDLKALCDADPNLRAIMTRTSDEYISLQDRVEFAERNRPDLFVSIHLNAASGGGSATARGAEFFYLNETGQGQLRGRIQRSMEANQRGAPSSRAQGIIERMARDRVSRLNRDSRRLCELIESEFNTVDYYRTRNRGVKTANFYVLKNALAPAVLVEVAFMTNDSDVRRLSQAQYQREVAQMIHRAIRRFAATAE